MHFDPVRAILKEKYGLVQARNSQLTQDLTIIWAVGRKLVYADSSDRGIYCVDFRRKANNFAYWPGDLIVLKYWQKALSLDVQTHDPMKSALEDVYALVRPATVTLGFEIGEPVDLEAMLKQV